MDFWRCVIVRLSFKYFPSLSLGCFVCETWLVFWKDFLLSAVTGAEKKKNTGVEHFFERALFYLSFRKKLERCYVLEVLENTYKLCRKANADEALFRWMNAFYFHIGLVKNWIHNTGESVRICRAGSHVCRLVPHEMKFSNFKWWINSSPRNSFYKNIVRQKILQHCVQNDVFYLLQYICKKEECDFVHR